MVSQSGDPRLPHVRVRASRACQACHARRVKCDAFERGTPCSRCCQLNLPGCDLIKSKRGTYTRRKKSSSLTATQTSAASEQTSDPQRSDNQHAADASRSLPGQTAGQMAGQTLVPEAASSAMVQDDDNDDEPQQSNTQPSPFTATMLDQTTPESQQSDTSRTSSRDITWTSMFEHVLNSHRNQDRQTAMDKCSITYLGETFPLAAVLEHLKQEGRIQLHHPGPPVVEESTDAVQGQRHPPHVPSEELAFLQAKGAFERPDADLMAAFTTTFFNRFYPCYPIVNRREFAQQLEQNKLPWLLLHSFCFICATFCSLAVLHRAKFADRREARAHFYNKAKYLFDFGYESNKIVVLQSVILLAFCIGE